MSYCEYVKDLKIDNVHRYYHDNEYGFPMYSDNELFGRLILEIFQAGLNWTIILNKKKNFENAFDGFNIEKVANYGDEDFERLVNDKGIIRNKLKINAAIYNANAILKIQNTNGSFINWLKSNNSLTLNEWVKLFKKQFKFTGPEITNEFLMSTGTIRGAHTQECKIYNEILQLNPLWTEKESNKYY